jgi:transposase
MTLRRKNRISSKKSHSTASAASSTIDPRRHAHAAGIDIGAEELVAAVPPGSTTGPLVRTFSSFTSGVEQLRDWLLACGVKTADMESTGNYWTTAYDLLEAAGIEVFLVNARHVKGVPGHKTDVQDAAWLQQLHAAGLLRKSYRPAAEILPLRYLMRHRQSLVAAAAQQVQAMQKVLTELNLKIQHVFSDVDGVSAQAIITAILAGERDPDKLAALRDRRCRSSTATIKEALHGSYREEYLFVLRQSQQTWQRLHEDIAACDTEIAHISARVEAQAPGPLPPPATRRKPGKNGPQIQIFEEAWRYYGVDLSAVPGVSAGLLSVLMSELGTGGQITTAFRSAQAFASWLGLCPDNRVSGGRVLKAKTRKVTSRVAGALRMGVFGLYQSDTKLGEYTRRMKARLGKAEGLTAAAHKLARILYALIKDRQPYDEAAAFRTTPQSRAKQEARLQKQAAALGFQLVAAA